MKIKVGTLTFILILLSTHLAANAKDIEITCVLPNANLPPFVLGDADKLLPNNPGVTPEHLELLFNKFKNVTLKIVRLPFARIASDLKTGRVDCGISFDQQPGMKSESRFFQLPLEPNNEGDNKKFFSESNLYLYFNSKKPIRWNGKTLQPKVKVHSPIIQFNRYAERHNIEIVSENFDIERQLQQLKMNRIEALLSLGSLTDPIIEKNDFNTIKRSQIPFAAIRNYLVFSNVFYEKNRPLVHAIWDKLPKMKNDKSHKIIRKKYGLE